MDFKKIGITGVVGFVSMAAIMPAVWGDWNYIAIDIVLTAVMYGVSGAAMGWSLERFKS